MTTNRHNYDDTFSVCSSWYYNNTDVYDNKQCGVIKHTKSACLLIIESTINHNLKLLQALDDGLKWVLSKNVNN